MSYLDALNPQAVLDTLNPHAHAVLERLGLRQREPTVVDILVPVLAAFGVGIVVGAAAGLLLAPQSGEDTRDDIADGAGKLAGKARDLGQNVRAQLPGGESMDAVPQRGMAPAVKPRTSPPSRTFGEG